MSQPTSPSPSGHGWEVETLRIHMEALRQAEERFQFERDRRYGEQWRHAEALEVERKAVIHAKEEAYRNALALQAETQKYKDEKANDLRTQINNERGLYPTRVETDAAFAAIRQEMTSASNKLTDALKPIGEYIAAQQSNIPRAITWPQVAGVIVFVFSIIGGIVGFVSFMTRVTIR